MSNAKTAKQVAKNFAEEVADDFEGMTVRDLIAALSKADPNAIVFVEREGEFRAIRPQDDLRIAASADFGITTNDSDLMEYTGPSVLITCWD